MKVTSKTPLYQIIEAVREQFGVNIDYEMAAEIRLKISDSWGALMEWTSDKLIITSLCLYQSDGIHEIGHEQVVCFVDGKEQVFIPEAWNELHPPVTLRRRPRWYIVQWVEYRGEITPEAIIAGPFDVFDEATDEMILHQRKHGGSYTVVSRSKCIRLGLLKDGNV